MSLCNYFCRALLYQFMNEIIIDIIASLCLRCIATHGGSDEVCPCIGAGDSLFHSSAVCHHKLFGILCLDLLNELCRSASIRMQCTCSLNSKNIYTTCYQFIHFLHGYGNIHWCSFIILLNNADDRKVYDFLNLGNISYSVGTDSHCP